MPPREASDEDLAARAACGDDPAFDRLADRYGLRLLRLLILTHHLPPDDAEDVAQDVWLKAWQGLPARRPGPFRGWLFIIARNAALDFARRPAQRMTPYDPDGVVLSLAPAPGPTPDRAAAAQDDLRKLIDCLERLGADLRAVVVGFSAGEPYEELAARLGTPVGTVKSRLSRGREALKTCLGTSAP